MKLPRLSSESKTRALTAVILAALSLLPPSASAQGPALPETPAGRKLASFLRALNSGDLETLRRFHAEDSPGGDAPPEQRAKADLNFYERSGGLDLHRIERSAEDEIIVLARGRKSGSWIRLTLQVESRPPHSINLIGAEPAPAPDAAPPGNHPLPPAAASPAGAPRGKLGAAEIAPHLEAYLAKLAADDEFSGVVLVAKDGRPVFQKAYGLADRRGQTPNRADTKFNLGSMNKMFTAVAVAQLAERGKLSFANTVGKHLPDYPNRAVANRVTIHHLLTHTSGLGSYWNEKFEARKGEIRTVADYLSLFAHESPAFEPGARFQYSNAGFIVLGAIIEKVSGQSYYDYVREHIYRPAGMRDTDAYEMKQAVPNLALGYAKEGAGPRRENTDSRPNRGGPAGGGYSTAADLLKFAEALRGGKLLSAKFTEIVTTGKVEAGRGKYAYGFGDRLINGRRSFGHNGGAPGIAADLSIFPDLGYTVVVLSNYDPRHAMPVVGRIQELITQG